MNDKQFLCYSYILFLYNPVWILVAQELKMKSYAVLFEGAFHLAALSQK